MTLELPQKDNRHKLTVNQHTFPIASIVRFANEKGAVQVLRKSSVKHFHAKPDNRIFCARRVWNQQAEGGFMKGIEDAFQVLANDILDDPAFRLSSKHFAAINEFYCLWNIRAQWKMNEQLADPSITSAFEVTRLLREYTQDEQEQLEAIGVNCIRPDFTLPSRHIVAPRIRLQLTDSVTMMGGTTWELLHADEGEFIVPDNFFELYAVPLSPTALLWAHGGFPSRKLDRHAVANINAKAVATSVEYFFARDVFHCPL
jgi:hypothetical protein